MATVSGTGFSTQLQPDCLFGSAQDGAVVPATIASSTELRCTSPSLGHAAPQMHSGYAYELHELMLGGNATRLRTAVRLSARADPAAGALEAPLPLGAPPLLDFSASWLLLLPSASSLLPSAGAPTAAPRPGAPAHRDDEARVGFRYGPLPRDARGRPKFGGEGAVVGLSVSVSDGGAPLVLEVRLADVTLLSRVLGTALARDTWMRLAVNVTDGQLSVTSDERVLVSALPLPGWAPSRAWQMGIGAHGARAGGRYVSALRLRSALILGLATVPVRVRMHGALTSNPLNFTFTADAVVSSVTPVSGPMSAPTRLTIRGANFNLGLAVACRFEQGSTLALVPATLVTNVSDAQINCTLGDGAATWQLGSIGVFVALGPQATYGPGTSFLRYPTPTLHALTPVLGVGNSTTVHIQGEGLGGGTDRRCRFGQHEAPATVVDAGGGAAPALRCLAPPATSAGVVDVAISLNGVQFVQTGAPLAFRYLVADTPRVSAVTPAVGPMDGATNVTVHGTNFVAMSAADGMLVCRFGDAMVNATFVSGAALRCTAPPAALALAGATLVGAGAVLVQMSLNRQEFYSGAPFAYMPRAGTLLPPVPSSKGLRGGSVTLVALSTALDPRVRDSVRFNCRFGECMDGGGGCSVTPGTLITLASVRCGVPAAPIAFGPDEQSRSISLALAPNGAQYTHHGANFTYLALEPMLLALEPPIGPLRGGTHVTVRGTGLALGTARRCRYALSPSVRVEVSATALFDKSGVVCVAPQTASAQPAPLEVTLNGVDWVGNVTHGDFTYTGSAAPDVIAPSSGPRHGGTSFYLGILPRPLSHMLASAGLAACRLGNDTHPASFDLQRGGLRCATPLLTPPAAVGEYPIYATINGQQFEPSPSATWRYVYSVQDLLSGNTASGGGGASPSPPSAPPSAPPPLGTPGSGTADLTQVGSGLAGSGATGGSGPSSPSSPSASATLRVGPLSGPTEGGTRLTLNASFALTLATELRCRFGHAAGGSVLATVAATSVFLGACVSPPLTAPGAIPLGLSLNGQQFYDFETFTSYAPAQPSRPSEPPSMAASRSPSSAPASAAAWATAPATLVRPSCLPPTTQARLAARCCDAACLRPMPPAFTRRSPFASTTRCGSASSARCTGRRRCAAVRYVSSRAPCRAARPTRTRARCCCACSRALRRSRFGACDST